MRKANEKGFLKKYSYCDNKLLTVKHTRFGHTKQTFQMFLWNIEMRHRIVCVASISSASTPIKVEALQSEYSR